METYPAAEPKQLVHQHRCLLDEPVVRDSCPNFSTAKAQDQAMLTTLLVSIANMQEWTKQQEADNLRRLFGDDTPKAKFARDHNVPGGGSMISQHLSGNRVIGLEAGKAYAAGFKVSLAEISPRLAKMVSGVDSVWDGNATEGPTTRGKYPLISYVQAGDWSEIVDTFQAGRADEWMVSPRDLGQHGFILRIEGASMTNPDGGKENFPEGMCVHIKPEVDTYPGDFVVAKRVGENKATFKKLVNVDGELYLHAINPAWPNSYIKLEPGDRIVGKMVFAGWDY